MQWRGFAYEPVFTESRRDAKLTLVFLRNWYSIECTEFEERVLGDPEIIAATRDLYCVKLEESTPVDRALALAWGVDVTPALVIVTPNAEVLVRRQGELSKADVLEAIAAAKAAYEPPPPRDRRQGARRGVSADANPIKR